MVHSAFDSYELLCNCPSKIESVACYGSKLLIGCSDASLRIYGIVSSVHNGQASPLDMEASMEELSNEPLVLERTLTGFSRKPLAAMEVLRGRKLLLSLSESISFHRLPSLEAVAVISKAKGANVFAWDDKRGFLCFARLKRIFIFRHEGSGGFIDVKEFGIPDTVKSLAWCGENVMVGIRREYMILNATSGVLSELFSSGRIVPPLLVSLPSGGLILGKDNIGVFVDRNGKLLQEGRICWSEPPTSVIIKKPHAIACLPRHVEAVSLRNARHLTQTDNAVIAVLENSITGLFPVPIGVQIVQLTASGSFEEALSLCHLLPPDDSDLRSAKEASIRLRYAHHLFDRGSYDESMDQFSASDVDASHVLPLYPSIILPEPPTACSGAISIDGGDEEERSELESKKTGYNGLAALARFLRKRRPGVIEKAAAEGTEQTVLEAVTSESRKPRRSAKVLACVCAPCVWLTRREQVSRAGREAARVLDTALLQALLLSGQSPAVEGLLKGANYCDVAVCEGVLKERGNDVALVELYRSNDMHREALGILRNGESHAALIEYLKPLCGSDPMLVLEHSIPALSARPSDAIELFLAGGVPPELVNSYLKRHAPALQATYLERVMSGGDVSRSLCDEMVHIHASRVVTWQADLARRGRWSEDLPSPARARLMATLTDVSGYSPDVFLKLLPPDALLEERAVLLGKTNRHDLALSVYTHGLRDPGLALEYCDRLHASGVGSDAYLTLLRTYLNPMVVPERRTRKRAARRKVVAEVEQMEDPVSDSTPSSGGSDAEMEEVSTEALVGAVGLVRQRWDRIDAAQALRMFPGRTCFRDLVPFVEPTLRRCDESRRNLAIVRSLRRIENVQVREELYRERRGRVKVASESTCCVCRKRIGTAVFAVCNDATTTLVHFVCFRDSQRRGKATPSSIYSVK